MVTYGPSTQTLAVTGLVSDYGGMTRHRGRWPAQRKIAMWLEDQRAVGRHPNSVTALARELGETQPKVRRWVKMGQRLKHDEAAAVAEMMGVTVDYLLDESQPYPPASLPSVDAVMDALPGELQAVWRQVRHNPEAISSVLNLYLAAMDAARKRDRPPM